MAFDQSVITEVFPPRYTRGQVFISWTSSAPVGTPFQVYVNRSLVWHGTGRSCWLAIPSGPSRVAIGAVGKGQDLVNFAQTTGYGVGQYGVSPYALDGSVPAAPARRAYLAWSGGSYLDPALTGFNVYGESSLGAGIDYSTPLATITAYPGGIVTDGFGLGSFGSGTFGYIASSYSWTSEPLSAGTWYFAIRSFDSGGNEAPAQIQAVTITGPPMAPGLMSDGTTRLIYSLSGFNEGGFGGGNVFDDGLFGEGGFGGGYPFGQGSVTLTWNSAA